MAESRDGVAVSPGTPVLGAGWTDATVTDKIAGLVLQRRQGWHAGWREHWPWRVAVLVSFGGVVVFLGASAWLFTVGVGLFGVNIPVAWGFALSNFVWWIGIGHAGTFISAILLLLRQRWRGQHDQRRDGLEELERLVVVALHA
ncbi:MAG: hypothetical protein ACTS5Y_00480, partial [Pollutimonas bauzanensis]